MNIEVWAAVGSLLVAIIGLVGAGLSWRARELRRDEVLSWSNEAIRNLQTLCLLCKRDEEKQVINISGYEAIWFSTSILIENGRLFFRNVQAKSSDHNKQHAYRGYRPLILDQLVIAHQIAERFPDASLSDRTKLRQIAETSRARFVSLAQKEVGRARTRTTATLQAGDSIRLDDLLMAHSKQL